MKSKPFDFAILRQLRKRDGLTIQDLSHNSGVSPAVISKLERNRQTAELGTLFSLSRAFGMNVTDLLALAESRLAHRKTETGHASGGFNFREIHYGNIRLLLGTAKAGGRTSKPEIHQDDLELCWVLAGQVRISLPHERQVLAAGQCIQFDAMLEHTYEVLEDCQVLIVHLQKAKRF
jgi:transcriptional regulator with XRE-family HTH domain